MNADCLREALFDPKLVAELRIAAETPECVIFKMKHSRYWVRIPKIPTNEIAYLAGAIAGDGNLPVVARKKVIFPTVRIRIYKKSVKYLIQVRESFRSEFQVDGRIHANYKKRCPFLCVDNKVVFLYFSRFLGINKKQLFIPIQLKNKDLFRHFLAGFFDTDGFRTHSFGMMLGAQSLAFMRELKDYCLIEYNLHFGKIGENTLNVNGKDYFRCQMLLKKSDENLFVQTIPLRHERWAR